MSENRLPDLLDHVREAAETALGYVSDMSKEDFLADSRTQQAVEMNLIIIGEASARIMDDYPEFVKGNPQVPWRPMRGMRNRMAHGYFSINLDTVWMTLKEAIPNLLKVLPRIEEGDDDEVGSRPSSSVP